MQLELRDVTYSYDGTNNAIEDIDLTLDYSRIVGIAGHTGSGKSTLIQHLNGVLHPTAGQVLLDGVDLAHKQHRNAAVAQVGVVFQDPEQQLFGQSVLEDVAFGPRNLGLDDTQVQERVHWALRKVGMDDADVWDKSPFELSGGQQRRVALAGVLAMEPRLLVLDEPVAGLDPAGHDYLLALIRKLHADGMGIVIVSHDMNDLAQLCDRIVVLNNGRIEMDGAPNEVFAQATRLRAIGLGVPDAQRVALDLRDAGMPLADDTLFCDVESLADAIAAAFAADEPVPRRSGRGQGVERYPSEIPLPPPNSLREQERLSPATARRRSVVHRMDPRVKLTLLLVYIAIALLAKSWLALGVLAAFTVAFFAAARISVREALGAWLPLSFIVLLTLIANLFFVQGGTEYVSWGFIHISHDGVHQALFMGARLSLLLFAAVLLTLTTTPLDLTDGMESMLAPFKRIGVPAHELSMIAGIALRFLPQLNTEFKQTRAAQLSRGAKLGTGHMGERWRALKALLVPLFAGAFRHADTLAAAMDARCYHGTDGRTRLHPLELSARDAWGTAAMLLLAVAVIACRLAC